MSPSLGGSHVSSAAGDLLLEVHLLHRRFENQLGKSGVVGQDTGHFFRRRRLEKLAPAHWSSASWSLGEAAVVVPSCREYVELFNVGVVALRTLEKEE